MRDMEKKKLETRELAERELMSEKIEAMRNVDIRTVDKSILVDIADVEIDTSLPDRERMLDFIRQVKNPYCYLDHGTVVKISFSGSQRMEDCLKTCVHLGYLAIEHFTVLTFEQGCAIITLGQIEYHLRSH